MTDLHKERRKSVADLEQEVRALQGQTYAQTISQLRQCYNSQQSPLLRQELARSFPLTHQGMQPLPTNLVRQVGESDAAVYMHPPLRVLEGVDQATQDVWQQAIDEAGLDLFMPQLEAALCVARTMFVRACFVSSERRLDLAMLWPCDVLVRGGADFVGTNLSQCSALAAKVSAPPPEPGASSVWWEMWERAPVTGTDTGTAEGGWLMWRVHEAGKHSTEAVAYRVLPWAVMHSEPPQGSAYAPADEDLLAKQLALSVTDTNLSQIVSMQSHTEKVLQTNEPSKTLVSGPGTVLAIGVDESLSTLDYSPRLEGAVLFTTEQLKRLAVSRGLSPEQYSTQSREPASGFARLVAMAPFMQRTKLHAQNYARQEVRALLPMLTAMLRHSLGLSLPEAPVFSVRFAISSEIETARDKQDRLTALYSLGLVRPEWVLTQLGYAPDEASALALLPDTPPGLG